MLKENDILKSTLSLSYNDFPYYLIYCLMYFSIFPAGDPITRTRLVRLWIAEGFVKEKEGMIQDLVRRRVRPKRKTMERQKKVSKQVSCV